MKFAVVLTLPFGIKMCHRSHKMVWISCLLLAYICNG